MVAENRKEKSTEEPIKIITLKHPYTFGTKQISECIFARRPKAKDLKGLKLGEGKVDDQFILLGRCTNLSTPEIEEMDLEDFTNVGQALTDFLPNGLDSGKIV